MNSVERVKAICKERRIAISRLERDLGYANGYIGQLRKGVLPDDRLVEIAQYLEVPTEQLLVGKKEAPAGEGGRVSEEDIKFALFGGGDVITDEMFQEVKNFAAFVKQREQEKKKE